MRAVVDRHKDDAGIIYCIRRADVEEIATELRSMGYEALPYHAGLDDDVRRQNQEAFLHDRVRVIVATVAFGMGIDKSDVRYVIHAAAPKSLESYQQESGRAGRDGLEAECWLFYSAGDFQTWRKLQQELPPQAFEIAMTLLAAMDGYTSGVNCRHRALVEYFGQELPTANCGACDVCLSEVDLVDDPLTVAQKILSCVVRVGQGYGGDYVAQVLVGSKEERIISRGHDRLSTYGLLAQENKRSVRGWIDQLVHQKFLAKTGEYNVLQLTEAGWQVLRGERTPRLLQPAKKARRDSRAELESWDTVDRGLFEALRAYRRRTAEAHGIPPFIVFSDATLRDLARSRPSSAAGLLNVHGIGAKKCAEYGADLVREITAYCRRHGVAMDGGVAIH